jgi:hypothetical protein
MKVRLLILALGVALAFSAVVCGGSSSNVSPVCMSCLDSECSSESAACNASSGCKTLRSCALACAPGDSACQNRCTAMAASDSTAVIAGANLLACADSACHSECWPPAGTGAAGTTGTGRGGTTGSGNASGQAGNTGSAGSPGTDLYCENQLQWAVGCAVDSETPFRNCNGSPLNQCNALCYIRSSCNDYINLKAGMHNELQDCLSGCAVSFGGATAPTCANARGKVYVCLDFSDDYPCDDTKALDRCQNACTLAASCTEIEGDPLNPVVSQYTMCLNTCAANNGGPAGTFVVGAGAYITAGTWKGYAWTGTDGVSTTTITPADFSAVAAGGSLCVSGTVAGTADYSAVAILGINVNQPMADTTTPMPFADQWDPINNNTNGLAYDITNTGGSPLRIQVQARGGELDQRLRWCAPVAGKTGALPWTTFNSACWDQTGQSYSARALLTSVMVLVPGGLSAVPFNFCLNSLAPY